MIIKKVNIIVFGGLKDKIINFDNGMNIIYGENEAGKSTIQAFIKIWLYGMANYKGKDYKQNDRLKYMPSTGETISGELYVEFKNKDYIIRRTFGKSKKEDTSLIIDAITGEEINYISKEEPGKYFFNINRATFINTLFISQLGVEVRKDKEGEIIASDIVNLVDDPHLKNGLASVGFDDEGVATGKTYLIKNGKLESLLHNLKTANKAGVKSTGNGFKASYASPISVSPTNMYIEPGINSLEEMTKKIDKGLIITDFAGLHSGANSITGDFSLAAKGFYIENGVKTKAVEQITVAGNFFTLLKDVEEIGRDLKFPMSSVGSPSILVKELSIAGEGSKNE